MQYLISSTVVINPLHMRKRVKVVYLSVCYHSTGFTVHLYHPDMVHTANIKQNLGFKLTDFAKNVLFKRYGVICLP